MKEKIKNKDLEFPAVINPGPGLISFLEKEEEKIPTITGPNGPLTIEKLKQFFDDTWTNKVPSSERKFIVYGYEPGRGWIPAEQTTAFQNWCAEYFKKQSEQLKEKTNEI